MQQVELRLLHRRRFAGHARGRWHAHRGSRPRAIPDVPSAAPCPGGPARPSRTVSATGVSGRAVAEIRSGSPRAGASAPRGRHRAHACATARAGWGRGLSTAPKNILARHASRRAAGAGRRSRRHHPLGFAVGVGFGVVEEVDAGVPGAAIIVRAPRRARRSPPKVTHAPKDSSDAAGRRNPGRRYCMAALRSGHAALQATAQGRSRMRIPSSG